MGALNFWSFGRKVKNLRASISPHGNQKPKISPKISDTLPPGKEQEEKIQEETNRRVIELDIQLQEKEKLKEREKSNLDALEDVTSLSREEIEQIASEVRESFHKKN